MSLNVGSLFFVDFAIKEVHDMEATGDGAARTTQSDPTEMIRAPDETSLHATDIQDLCIFTPMP